jgi:xylulose-5-phosphate/fructose-6-phosphate phosphoketolase
MTVLNRLDRFHLAQDAFIRVPKLGSRLAEAKARTDERLRAHHAYIREHGEDLPSVRDWRWPG